MSNLREDRRAEASSGRATEDQAEQRITRQLDEARGIARTMAQNGGNGSVIYGALSKMPRFKDLP
ncbi:MAG: hypothetical protein ACRENP_10550 [Longimicrobiales bacterium]